MSVVLGFMAAILSGALLPGRVAAGPVISEFLAENADGLTDEDGDHSDWIEVANTDPTPVDLQGWRLTDNSANPSKWKFPPGARLEAFGRLVVFASGKNRIGGANPPHTNFKLKKEGGQLALYPPAGSTPASAFLPYPAQYQDVSYGIGLKETGAPLVVGGAKARIAIPPPGDGDRRWTGEAENEPFPDQGWIEGTTRAGYDDRSTDLAQPLLGYWNFDDNKNPSVALDASGLAHHGVLVGPAKFTDPGGGRSGLPGDRALDLGTGGNGSSVRVDSAATGAFDLLQKLDRVTVSLWAFGGPELPVANCVFWFDTGAASGDTRNIMAHLPWSDGVIYFDTAGCCAGDTRIYRQETDTTKWRGQWNHYVFLKDGPRKEIWQNGVLWLEGAGAIPLKGIKSLWLGSASGAGISYPGKLDEIAVWAGALSPSDIQALTAGLSPLSVGSYRPFIDTDLARAMRGVGPAARMRVAFTLPPPPLPDKLELAMRYDDGFVAWLNGVEIVRQNVPVTGSRAKADGLKQVVFELETAAQLLRPGTNILAVEGVNDSASGSDFLLNAELWGANSAPGRYFVSPTPLERNGPGAAGLTSEIGFAPGRGFFDKPVAVTLSCPTPGATIHYTLDGSLPTLAHGVAVRPPDRDALPSVTLTLTNTTAVRAFAEREDFEPSPTRTHTYIFAAQVEKQPAKPPGYPSTWGVYGAYGPTPGQPVPADYEMDSRVTKTTTPGYSVREAILSLPTLSVSTDVANLFDPVTGIYPNSVAQGAQWVRPASAEMIFPNGDPGFQIDAGLRIHGGLSRQHWHARKHSFRLQFQKEFGPSRLHFRLFDDTRVSNFNEITLRGSSTDSWAVEDAEPWTRPKATYMRDPWMKDTEEAMGWPCGHSRYVHLFLNGLYWGQYNMAERTEPVWLSENYGGAPEDYDVVKDGGEVESGNRVAWDAMIAMAGAGLATDSAYWRIQGRSPIGIPDPTLPVYLDVDNLIDYMILHIYSGAMDWPNHNWWSGRRRTGVREGFRFYVWDQEISNISLTTTTTYPGEAFASVSGPTDTPAFLYAKLRANPLFRARFSARVIALTTGFGLLTPPQNAARWERRQAEIDHSIVAESSRWGDSRQALPLKRGDWIVEMNWMRNTYWPQIHKTAIARFAGVGLYSTSSAPSVVITPAGGIVAVGTRATLSGGPGIYYTTNGTDPITPRGELANEAIPYTASLGIAGPTRIRARRTIGADWSSLAEAFFLLATNTAPPSVLAVSEIHYHPQGDEAEEFVEVRNNSATQHAVLGGARLSGGIDFAFPNGWLLPPGGLALAVRGKTAFEARYGTGKPVAGEFSGNLANAGDWVRLLAPSGRVLSRIQYGDAPPWPRLADGGNRSLTFVRSAQTLDPTDPRNWRASATPGGTPGWEEGAPFSGNSAEDADGDGLSALAEYFLGTSDTDRLSGPGQKAKITLGPNGEVSLALNHPLAADQVEVYWETSPDLLSWQPVAGWPSPESNIQGETESLLWRAPSGGDSTRFYRLRLRLR